jgi:hypothetical protein
LSHVTLKLTAVLPELSPIFANFPTIAVNFPHVPDDFSGVAALHILAKLALILPQVVAVGGCNVLSGGRLTKISRSRDLRGVRLSPVPSLRNEIYSYRFAIGVLLLLTQAQEPDRQIIHLTEITCRAFVEEMKREERNIIVAWLQGYYLPEHDPPVIDVDELSSDSAKLSEHCLGKSGRRFNDRC